MARDNNGVARKVTNFANAGDGGGQAGNTRDNGGAANQMSANAVMADMASHHGPKGSSGTVKDMGGVGDYGQDANMHQKGFFGTQH